MRSESFHPPDQTGTFEHIELCNGFFWLHARKHGLTLRQSHKTILIWAILILMFVSIYSMFTDSSTKETPLDVTAFRADFVLETTIRDFQAGYDAPNGPPRVSVAINAKLVKIPERKIVGQTSFSREAAVVANDVPAVVRAFGEALGAAAGDLVAWTVTNPGLSQRRASLH